MRANLIGRSGTALGAAMSLLIGLTACGGGSSRSGSSPRSAPTTASAGAGADSSSFSQLSPSQILAQARAAAIQEQWAHIEARGTSKGTSVSIADDAGPNEGREDITVGPFHALVLLVGGIVYLHGDQQTLENFYGMPAGASAEGAGKWISVGSADPGYSIVNHGVSLAAALDQLFIPTDSLSKQTIKTVSGQPVIGIKGRIGNSPPSILYVSTNGDPLPVEEIVTVPSEDETVTFSNWGHSIPLAPPSGATPISRLIG